MMMAGTLLAGCAGSDNPFFQPYDTPYGVPPFDKIKTEHYLPAFREGIARHEAEVQAIATNADAPTFDNTIAALDYSGELLTRVGGVFFNLYESDANDALQQIATEVSPMLSEHEDNIYMNDALFRRVAALYEGRDTLGLTGEQNRLLENYYKSFVRKGAALDEAGKARLREINKELSLAELEFGQNVLAETNTYKLFLSDEADLAGLPASVKQAAAEAAAAEGHEGEWLFTTQKSSFLPVLQYADNRDLRKTLQLAYANLANNGGEHDNKAMVNRIVKLRVEQAHLLGYESPAALILDNTMAKTPEAVYAFLDQVWQPSLAAAKREAAELQKLMDAEGKGEKLEPWDWAYYAEKLRQQRYALDEEEVRAYFQMENVRQGAFGLANKLYGLQFKKLEGMPLYHPDVEAFEVTDADGSLIGVLYTDYYPRASKRAGAWMSEFRGQYKKDGIDHRPIVVNVGNFTKPTADRPSLLTMDDVETLFHEFGHALHGLLSQCTYPSIAGTNVTRDFVELPSQIMENWCFEPQVLKNYARHYRTGEVMPDSLIAKLQATATFNQGFIMTELLSASLLDMDYHARTTTDDLDVAAFEKASLDRIGLIPEIIVRYRSTYFNHIFSGGYAAGYYSYTWSAVLDADAFQAFKETGDIYNKDVATAFRTKVLERGGSDDPMKLYIDFRGAAPDPDALLRRNGLK